MNLVFLNAGLGLPFLIAKFASSFFVILAINAWMNQKTLKHAILVVISTIILVTVSCHDFTSIPISNGMLLYYI